MPREKRKYTKDNPTNEPVTETSFEFVTKTASLVSFLCHIYDESIMDVAAIQAAQADKDIETLQHYIDNIKEFIANEEKNLK